jgi:hypothetical protein
MILEQVPTTSTLVLCRNTLLLDFGSRTSGKSTQKAFMFIPYRNPAKLSENRARLSCISCNCRKFCSRSAMASLNSAKPSCKPSSALPDAEAARPRWDESRKEEREDGRRGVVGRDRGDLLRVRRYEGVVVGVVEAMYAWQWVLVCPSRIR